MIDLKPNAVIPDTLHHAAVLTSNFIIDIEDRSPSKHILSIYLRYIVGPAEAYHINILVQTYTVHIVPHLALVST